MLTVTGFENCKNTFNILTYIRKRSCDFLACKESGHTGASMHRTPLMPRTVLWQPARLLRPIRACQEQADEHHGDGCAVEPCARLARVGAVRAAGQVALVRMLQWPPTLNPSTRRARIGALRAAGQVALVRMLA